MAPVQVTVHRLRVGVANEAFDLLDDPAEYALRLLVVADRMQYSVYIFVVHYIAIALLHELVCGLSRFDFCQALYARI